METGIKSSFIPQAPITPMQNGARTRGGGGFDFFIVVAIVFFVASATLAVGVFLYGQYVSTSAASKLEQLERAKESFQPALVNELTRLDDRMRIGDEVLSTHIAPSALFDLLEQLTLQTVAFSTFSFGEKEKSRLSVTMDGVAQSVNSIALQADLLSKSGVIVNPIFSNINRQANGVHFDFSAEVNRSALRYQNEQLPEQQSVQQPMEPASPFGVPASGEAPPANEPL